MEIDKLKIKKFNINLMVENIEETVNFYKDNLNFKLVMAVPKTLDSMDTELKKNTKYAWAQIKNNDIEIMLQEQKSLKQDVKAFSYFKIGASVTFYFEIENASDFYEKVKDKVEIIKELQVTWYKMKEFYIKDNNGYILCFAEQEK